MISYNTTPSQLAEFGMPVCGRVRVASVRALGDATHTAAIKGVFPGPYAWSPPN